MSDDRPPPETAENPGPGPDLARATLAAAREEARRRRAASGAWRGQRAADMEGSARPPADAGQRRPAQGQADDEREPQSVGTVLDGMLAERGWRTRVAVAGVMARWGEIVGADLAAHCEPEGFTEGVLTIRADSTAWATQVRLLAPDLLRRLNGELGQRTVERVVVRGPSGPAWGRGGLRAPGSRGPRDTYG